MDSDDDAGDTRSDSPFTLLASRVAREGLVRLAIGDTRVVCLTEAAFDRLASPDTPPVNSETSTRAVHLSPREEQALRLVSTGRTAAEAATELGLAVNTVSQHLVSARRKYGVTSTRAAVEHARRDGRL